MADEILQASSPLDGQMGAQTQKAIPAGTTETAQISLAIFPRNESPKYVLSAPSAFHEPALREAQKQWTFIRAPLIAQLKRMGSYCCVQ
jgi:hypothetical protein